MEDAVMGERLIKPFTFAKPNQCRYCKGKLELVDEDIQISKLDSKGLPINGIAYTSQRLRCTKCGEEFDAEKKGMYFKIATDVPPIPVIMEDYNPFYQR